MGRPVVLRLTWAGLDAAVDVLAAHRPPGVELVCGMDRGGMLLAWALSERLGIECSRLPVGSGWRIYGLIERHTIWPSVSAWVDATPRQAVQSVMKATPGTLVLMPWQDAGASPRPFVPGFDD